MARMHDALSCIPCLPFAKRCLQLHVRPSKRHSNKKLEVDIENCSSMRLAVFAKQLFNIWRAMHTRATLYIRHFVE